MNKFIFSGNLCGDPSLTTTQNGKPMAKFSIAVKRPYSKDTTDFFDVVAWNGLAELCGKYLEKGKKVVVVGYVTTRTYEKDGQTRKIWEVYAEDIEFLSRNSKPQEELDQDIPF